MRRAREEWSAPPATFIGPVKFTQVGTESTNAGVATNSMTIVLRTSTK